MLEITTNCPLLFAAIGPTAGRIVFNTPVTFISKTVRIDEAESDSCIPFFDSVDRRQTRLLGQNGENTGQCNLIVYTYRSRCLGNTSIGNNQVYIFFPNRLFNQIFHSRSISYIDSYCFDVSSDAFCVFLPRAIKKTPKQMEGVQVYIIKVTE